MDKQTDWHDWLKEAQRWCEAGDEGACWRCLLRWASRIEFFNEA